jgi:hypothetical protein
MPTKQYFRKAGFFHQQLYAFIAKNQDCNTNTYQRKEETK